VAWKTAQPKWNEERKSTQKSEKNDIAATRIRIKKAAIVKIKISKKVVSRYAEYRGRQERVLGA